MTENATGSTRPEREPVSPTIEGHLQALLALAATDSRPGLLDFTRTTLVRAQPSAYISAGFAATEPALAARHAGTLLDLVAATGDPGLGSYAHTLIRKAAPDAYASAAHTGHAREHLARLLTLDHEGFAHLEASELTSIGTAELGALERLARLGAAQPDSAYAARMRGIVERIAEHKEAR